MGFDLSSFAGDLFGGWLNNSAANQRQVDANNFSANQYASRYQTTVADMKAAGLNPMLAYQQGAGNAPTGQIAQGAPFSNQMGTNAAIAGAQVSSANQAEAQTELIKTTVDKVVAETSQTNATTQQITTMLANLDVQRSNMIKEGYNLTEQGNVLRATFDQISAMVPNIREDTLLKYANEAKANTENALGQLDLKAGQDMNNLGRNAAQFKPLIDLILGVVRGGSHFSH